MIIAKKNYYSFAFENTQNVVIFSVTMKMVLSQSDFLHLASSSMFSINNYMYEKNQVTHRKRENMCNAGVKGFLEGLST